MNHGLQIIIQMCLKEHLIYVRSQNEKILLTQNKSPLSNTTISKTIMDLTSFWNKFLRNRTPENKLGYNK